MNTRLLIFGAGTALVLATSIVPTLAATVGDDCSFLPPPVERPDVVKRPGDVPADALTQRLTTCGSVINPPAVGDPDIVTPTPPVDDDINVHPDAPSVRP